MLPGLAAALEGVDLSGRRVSAPWMPEDRPDSDADCVRVDFHGRDQPPVRFSSLQAAIDQIMAETPRDTALHCPRVIRLGPGYFSGPVIVPRGAPPLTICGAGIGETVIAAGIDAQMSGAEYAATFSETIHAAGRHSREAFARIIARQRIGTGNTAVLRICSDTVLLRGLTLRNDYACDRLASVPAGAQPDVEGRFAVGQHQAVALMLDDADRVIVEDCALSSFQDTLYLRSVPVRLSRSVFRRCEIEGDVDFIFGGAIGHFEDCVIRARGERGAQGWTVAPSTQVTQPCGFVFERCRFEHDGAEAGRTGGFLGRQWFEGVRATPYGAPTIDGYECRLSEVNRFDETGGSISHRTLHSVGKCVLSGCHLGDHLNPARLWDDWAGGAWSPRYRPVQPSPSAMLAHLEGWLPPDVRHMLERAGDAPWLSVAP